MRTPGRAIELTCRAPFHADCDAFNVYILVQWGSEIIITNLIIMSYNGKRLAVHITLHSWYLKLWISLTLNTRKKKICALIEPSRIYSRLYLLTSQIIYEVGTKVTKYFHTLQAAMKNSLFSLIHYSKHLISILGSRNTEILKLSVLSVPLDIDIWGQILALFCRSKCPRES